MDFLYTKTGVLKWLILLALVLLIFSFVSFWFGRPSFSENDVKLEIEGPNQVTVGDEVVYKLKYANKSKLDLHNVRIKFSYPEDSVVLKDGTLSKELTEVIDLDELSGGQTSEKEFRVFLVGDRGNIKTAKAEISYRAGDLRTNFEKSVSLATTITSLPISLTLVAPPTSTPGQSVNYLLDYRNESGNDVSGLRFEFDYPEGFSFQRSVPDPSERNSVWSIPSLQKGKGGRISIQGLLNGKEGQTKVVALVLKRKIGDEYVDYEKAKSSSLISNPLVGVDIVVNDLPEYSAYAGDTLDYKIKYSNNSNYNLVGVNLSVRLEGDMYDFSSLDTRGGYFDDSSNTILWNAGAVSDFGNLAPNQKGQVSFKIKLNNSISSGVSGSKNLFVRSTARLSTPNVPSGVGGDELFAQDSLVTKISTQPTLRQTVYYKDSAFGSSGPMPPEVGKETSFTIRWQITNPGNDMTKVKISGVLPSGVNWKNVVSIGSNQPDLTYNKNTSEVSWNLGVLPQGVGVISPKYEASFQVSIKPSVNQKDSAVTLLKDLQLSGEDTFTKQEVIIPVRDMTTDETVDRAGEGRVQ